MSLSTAMFTSLTGLDTSSTLLSVSGNNIANVNTAAFKRSRVTFQTQISRSLQSGSAPTEELGGTNPAQVGLGVGIGSIRRDFSDGALQPTGVNTDMAIEGAGFFMVDVSGSRQFTRDGGFTLDRDFNLVHPGTGGVVQGFGVDDDFKIVDGVLENISIPMGILTLAEPTQEVKFTGNLNAGGDVATKGSITTFAQLFSDATATTDADGTTALTSLFDSSLSGSPLFVTGDVITLTGITRGGATVPDKTFEVGAANTTESDAFGTTVQDLMDLYQDIMGIDTGITSGTSTPGVTITGGVISIESNVGTANAIEMADGSAIVNQGTAPVVPFDFTQTQQANGESVRTTFVAYDSLGNEVVVDLTVVLQQKDNTGTQWQFYAQSQDDTDLNAAIGTGIAQFDNNGKFIAMTDKSITINRDNTGAISPLTIDMDFSDPFGSVSALFDTNSQISAVSQDGSPIGTLEDFSVGSDGILTGIFSNGLLRSLGQIPVATFANTEGLEELGGNMFRLTPSSGIPIVVTPTTGGSGRIIGRALELSNVDLAEEFVNLISASTGFSSSSRVLSTSDRLIQELLATIR